MNRLVIIGNGFDLYHGYKTSYKDFIAHLLAKVYSQKDYNKQIATHQRHRVINEHAEPAFEDVLKEVYSTLSKNNFNSKGCFDIKSEILKGSLGDIQSKGWTDIERLYHRLLADVHTTPLTNIIDKEARVKLLNDDLANITKELHKYLMSLEVHHAGGLLLDFEDLPLTDGSLPDNDETCILNFNYTKTFFGRNENYYKINIHGTLDEADSIIFGYGDETDELYHKLESLDSDEWIKGFKSFKYVLKGNYKKMVDFIESYDYQVMVIGHSCGRSDKVLLNEILTHKNCKEIEIIYHRFDDGSDNFSDIAHNIGRVMPDKKMYRRRLTHKANCRTMDEIHQS